MCEFALQCSGVPLRGYGLCLFTLHEAHIKPMTWPCKGPRCFLSRLSSQWGEKGTSSGQFESQVGLISFREDVDIKII